MEAEIEKIPNTGTKNLFYSESVITGIGQKKGIFNHPPHEWVEENKENTIIGLNHYQYHQ